MQVGIADTIIISVNTVLVVRVMIHSHLGFSQLLQLRERFCVFTPVLFIANPVQCTEIMSKIAQKWVHNPLFNFKVHVIAEKIAGVNGPLGLIHTKRQRQQLCDDGSDTLLIENNGVA